MDVKDILSKVDHTLLSQTATWEQIRAVLDDGWRYQVASVCIPAAFVARAKAYVAAKGLVGLHRTIQLQLLQHYWLVHRLRLL